LFEILRTWLDRWQASREMRKHDPQHTEDYRNYAEEQISVATESFGAGDRERAQAIWNDVNGLYPDPCMNSKAGLRLLLDFGAFDQAESMLREGERRYPRRPHFATGLAELARRQGNLEQALRHCAAARRKFPFASEGYTIAAACLIGLGRNNEAEAMLARTVRKFPNNVDVLVEHARLAERRQDWQEALLRWEAVRNRDASPGVALSLAACLRVLGRYAEAEELATSITDRLSGGHWAYLELARIAAAQQDFEREAGWWEGVRKHGPFFAPGYLEGAQASRRVGREAEADEILQEGVERLRSDLDIHLEYARSAQRRGDWTAAAERWALVRERFPECDEASMHEAAALAALAASQQGSAGAERPDLSEQPDAVDGDGPAAAEAFDPAGPTVEEALTAARMAWRAGEQDNARAAWSGTDAAPAQWVAEARVLIDAGLPDAAEAMLDVALTKLPDSRELLFEQAMVVHRRGDQPTAAARFTACARRFPTHPDAWALGLRALRDLGRLDEAALFAAEAVEALPENVAVLCEAANVAEARRELGAVRTLCGQVRTLYPQGPDAYIVEARASRAAGELDAAERVLAAANKASNPHPGLLVEASAIAEARKDFVTMASLADELRRDYPSIPYGYEMTLRCQLATGKLDAAEALLASLPPSIAARQEPARVGCNLAMRRGDYEEAVRRCADAVTRFPDNGEFQELMAVARRNAGENSENDAEADLASRPAAGTYEAIVLQTLQTALDRTASFDSLVDLERSARDAQRDFPESPRFVALIGAILRKRFEWEASSTYLLEMAAKFPNALELQYRGALTAIDAGNYRRAQAAVASLASKIDLLDGQQLRGIWRAAPLVGLHDIALDAFARARANGAAACTSAIANRLAAAQGNAASPAVNSVNVISIGENCLPWSLAQRWGLRSSETMFSQESPFNLAQTTTNDVAALLEDGVDRLVERTFISELINPDGVPRPQNAKYHFDFNHEQGKFYVNNCFDELISVYSVRIDNLKRILSAGPCVYVHYTERGGDLDRLVRSVRMRCHDGRSKIIIFDSWEGNRQLSSGLGDVVYHKVTLPGLDYAWFRPDDFDSDDGIAFERTIQGVILREVVALYENSAVAPMDVC
jgi:tetratricopeptide (TPR) repeat protein